MGLVSTSAQETARPRLRPTAHLDMLVSVWRFAAQLACGMRPPATRSASAINIAEPASDATSVDLPLK